VTTFAASVFGPRAELTTTPFNPGPHGKIRVTAEGSVLYNAEYGERAGVDGTLTCSKGGRRLSASSGVIQTLLPFTTTYSTNATGIRDPKMCTLSPFAFWDPETPPSDARNWPKGYIVLTVFLKK
jgi:tetrahydromethanopterin S-methyltransferase subunit E